MGSRVPVRTFMDWNEPRPGYLEIDLVAHGGGAVSGGFIHRLVATDVCSGWTEAVPLLAREQSLVVLARIHRTEACGKPAEEVKGCSYESGIMVL